MIRHAGYEDVEDIIVLCREFHNKSCFKGIPFSPNQCRTTIRSAIRDDTCCVLYSGTGFIAGAIRYTAFSAVPIAQEIAWFATGADGFRLLIEYEEWVKAQGVEVSTMTTIHNDVVDTERVFDLLVKRGYQPAERTLMKDV